MTHVESELSDVRGSKVFAKIDFCSGCWQLSLGEEGQEALSFMTPNGVQKPLRSTHGDRNCGPNFQSPVELCIVEIREHLKVWIDDFLVHHQNENCFPGSPPNVFKVCRNCRLKISAKKTVLFAKQVR